MEIDIKVVAENIQTQTVRHANSCFFTMVAVDEARTPIKAPVFKPETATDLRRFEAAEKRRQQRYAAASKTFIERSDDLPPRGPAAPA